MALFIDKTSVRINDGIREIKLRKLVFHLLNMVIHPGGDPSGDKAADNGDQNAGPDGKRAVVEDMEYRFKDGHETEYLFLFSWICAGLVAGEQKI